LEKEIRTYLAQHATKNAQIIVLLVIDRQEVKELARVPVNQSQIN
jgi:predicted XRE-type DNA-binding protein